MKYHYCVASQCATHPRQLVTNSSLGRRLQGQEFQTNLGAVWAEKEINLTACYTVNHVLNGYAPCKINIDLLCCSWWIHCLVPSCISLILKYISLPVDMLPLFFPIMREFLENGDNYTSLQSIRPLTNILIIQRNPVITEELLAGGTKPYSANDSGLGYRAR